MLDYIYHDIKNTYNLHFWCENVMISLYATLKWMPLHCPKICKPRVVYQFFCIALYHSQTRHHVINFRSMMIILAIKNVIILAIKNPISTNYRLHQAFR